MKRRILHINKRYPPHVGGVERHVQDLARAQVAQAGHEVEVLCVAEERVPRGAGRPAPWERDRGVAVARVPEMLLVASNPVSAHVPLFLLDSLRKGRHDIWHFHYPFPTGEAALLGVDRALRRGRRRGVAPAVVCSYHADFVGEAGLKRVLSEPYALLTRRFLGTVDRIVAASPQVAHFSRFLPSHEEKVRVVPYGIDPALLAGDEGSLEAAAALRARVGVPMVLFVGRLVPYKGVEVLLRACALIQGRGGSGAGRPFSLVIVGEGPLLNRLRTLTLDLGLSATVHFVGAVTDSELVAYYRAADVFVLPSVTSNEAFGLVQLEAHACGVPVVSTDLPTGVPFANADGITGLVVPPRDSAALAAALERLLADDDLRARLGRQARDRMQREFSLQAMIAGIDAVYEEALLR